MSIPEDVLMFRLRGGRLNVVQQKGFHNRGSERH